MTRLVPSEPSLRYLVMKVKPRGQGHIAIFEVLDHRIVVVDIFHTAQAWQSLIVR
jgi:hypothetical protein